MRILHVTPAFAPSIGGIEDVVHNLATRAREAGLQADVVHAARGLKYGSRREHSYTVTTLPLVGHRVCGWIPGLARLASGYDLLHVHDPQVGALTLSIGGAAAAVPAVISTHGGFLHTPAAMQVKRLHARFSAPRLLRRYSRVLACSHTDLALFRPQAPHTILVENGVSTSKLASGAAAGRGDLRRWIYWGRFSRNKRIDSLIRLVAGLARVGLPIDLAICGNDFDGQLASLRTLSCSLGLQDQVTFRTGLDDGALRAEIATRSVFVLPSEYEGFGLSVLEAMGAGLIPACRDIAPVNTLAGSSAVLLDFDGGPRDIARVRELLAAPPWRVAQLRDAALARATSFDWKARFDAFLDQYRECVRLHGQTA